MPLSGGRRSGWGRQTAISGTADRRDAGRKRLFPPFRPAAYGSPRALTMASTCAGVYVRPCHPPESSASCCSRPGQCLIHIPSLRHAPAGVRSGLYASASSVRPYERMRKPVSLLFVMFRFSPYIIMYISCQGCRFVCRRVGTDAFFAYLCSAKRALGRGGSPVLQYPLRRTPFANGRVMPCKRTVWLP